MHLVTKFYRLSCWLKQKKIPLLPDLMHKLMRVIFTCDIKYTVKIGENINLFHNGLGVVIHKYSIIGENVSIYQNVTIGGNGKEEKYNGHPIIGDNVIIGAGAVILGPVKIGDNAKIGANAVVITDIPTGATAVGVPARFK